MKKIVLSVAVAVALTLASASTPAQTAATAVAFVNVAVVPMDRERIIDNQTVVVRDGKISAMGPAASLTVPPDVVSVDARGKYLLPGLSDMHGHLPGGDGTNDDAVSQFLKLYLANGVTTVRGMIGSPGNLVVREKIARGELLGPAIVAAGPPLNGKSAATPEMAVAAVQDIKTAGYDLIKVHEGLTAETYAALTAAAKRTGLKVAGHVTAGVGLDRALAAGQSSIEHLDKYLQALVPTDAPVQPTPDQVQSGPALAHMDERRIPGLVARTKAANVWNTPTLALFEIVVSLDSPETFLAWPEMQYIPAGLRGNFAKQKAGTANIPASVDDRARYVELRRKIVKGLHDGGAGLLVGPDTPQLFLVPGFATHRELAAFVTAGLSPFSALQAATTSPAAYLGRGDEMGTVAVGKRADLLLVDANPLADIANARKIAGVVASGRWLPRVEIDRMLSELAAMHKAK